MKDYFQNVQFIFGLLLIFFILGFVNFFATDFLYHSPDCYGYLYEKGFPFTYSQKCEDPSFNKHLIFGLIGNILFAVICGIISGILLKFIWSKLTSKQLK